jgi:hypothetical protein
MWKTAKRDASCPKQQAFQKKLFHHQQNPCSEALFDSIFNTKIIFK